MIDSRQNPLLRPRRQAPALTACAPAASRNTNTYRLTRALIAYCGDYLSDPARIAARIRRHLTEPS